MMYGEVDAYFHIFLNSTLAGGKWPASRPAALHPGKEPPGDHWIGGCCDPRDGMDNVEKKKFFTLPGLELRHFGCSARSQSLYIPCYSGSCHKPSVACFQTIQTAPNVFTVFRQRPCCVNCIDCTLPTGIILANGMG
jgi:hypothetical protein